MRYGDEKDNAAQEWQNLPSQRVRECGFDRYDPKENQGHGGISHAEPQLVSSLVKLFNGFKKVCHRQPAEITHGHEAAQAHQYK